MAIYHLSIKIISRGKGKSAVASAAYRAGEKITNEREGLTHDYSRKKGIEHVEIMLPEHAPKEFLYRSVLWTSVEKIEKAKNAQLAREIEVALPKELTAEQNINLVREYIKNNFTSQGMCADLAIHDKKDGNPHCHIMLTTRPLKDNGEWGEKEKKDYAYDEHGKRIPLIDPHTGQQKVDKRNRKQWKRVYIQANDWNNSANAEDWREKWGQSVNALLVKENHIDRIDHRSYKRQGVDKIPTIHFGVSASQMERKGIRTERGNHNRQVDTLNKEIRQLKARINKLSNWIDEEMRKPEQPEQPMLADVIQDILSRQAQAGKSQYYQSINNLKNAAKMMNFLTQNNIADMDGMNDKVKKIHGRLSDVRSKLKPIERRLKTLDEHIMQAENYKNYKPIKHRYDELHAEFLSAKKATGLLARRKEEKTRVAFNEYAEENRSELLQFDNAEKYFKDVLQERFNPKKLPPITKWKEERKTLTAEKDLIYRDYYSLKDEVKEVEKIKRGVDNLMKEQEHKPRQKKHEMEL